MSFIPCSYCGRRNCGALRHVYWFAPLRNAEVLRVRQRLCPDCLGANLSALLTPLESEALTCSACGIGVEDDVRAIYVTWYPDGKTLERGAIALCESHFQEMRERITLNALELPDRYLDETDLVSFRADPPVPLSYPAPPPASSPLAGRAVPLRAVSPPSPGDNSRGG